MTARPQQMPDGQDKSDDLIAELAKLMASNAGSEPEAKPAPKLVTLPEGVKPDAPAAAAPVRIPGMDNAARPQPAPPVAAPSPTPAGPGVLRIPGMDRPVPMQPAPAVAAAAPRPVESKPAASFDFGTVSAAPTFKPEPMSSWQDREIPRPVPSRPVAAPAPAPVVAAPVAAAPQVTAFEPAVTAPVDVPAPKPAAAAPQSSPMVEAAQASSSADNFDFDFGFATNPPEPIAAGQAKPAAPVAAPSVSDDPIADLIAAELDSTDAGVEAAAPQPAPRSFTPTAATPSQRPVQAGPVPFRAPTPSPQPQASRPEEQFGVAPTFGQAGRSQVAARPQAPQQAADPMEEIESLIGEAVRVELTDKPAPAPVAAPVAPQAAAAVPPLTAGIPPRRAAIRDRDSDVGSPEAAILAAAAASGAEVGNLDGVVAEPSPYKRVKAKPERRASGGMRQYVGMAVAGTLLLAAGLGLYWVLGLGGSANTEAPVLTADATPIKEVPPPAPASTTTPQGSVVFNELDGGNATAPVDEVLVSRDDSAATSVADVARTVGGDGEDAVADGELANRKVRTVTVRPDGTIVSGDEAVAGNEELPVDRPNVPDLPGADVQPSELLAAIPAGDTAVVIETPAVTDPNQVSALAATTPAPEIDVTIVAPIPVARPVNRAALSSGTTQQIAATQPVELAAPAPAAAAPVASGGSGPYVQLSSQPSQADAQASLRAMQNRMAGMLGNLQLEVRQVDLGARGIWYRVALPVPSFQDATDTCNGLKNNGIDCLPIGG
ncbi:MAG: hypothetical protein ACO1OG_04400 [Devosia sp.]